MCVCVGARVRARYLSMDLLEICYADLFVRLFFFLGAKLIK
jgi:hypothetical protein